MTLVIFVYNDNLNLIDYQYYIIIDNESYSGRSFANVKWIEQKMILNVKPE